MALVDYTSDSSSESEEAQPPPAKKPKTEIQPDVAAALPPLPASFHDLYASTVRQAPTDDPSLHQGRTRHIPHVAGNWPSHLYVEWHPSAAEHSLLAALLAALQRRLGDAAQLTTFLTSDLGAPQPLHISLSRPFVLPTPDKAAFLTRITAEISSCGVQPPFRLRTSGLEWHRTPASRRSFLVLRVRDHGAARITGDRLDADNDKNNSNNDGPNPRLTRLLQKCNAAVRAFNQPELYQWAGEEEDRRGEGDDASVGDAFHVSIAWSFVEPDDELRSLTAELAGAPEYAAAVSDAEISVDGIKAKIGNVVTHIPLPERGKRVKSRMPGDIFGI